jgi:hypothetical protein
VSTSRSFAVGPSGGAPCHPGDIFKTDANDVVELLGSFLAGGEFGSGGFPIRETMLAPATAQAPAMIESSQRENFGGMNTPNNSDFPLAPRKDI